MLQLLEMLDQPLRMRVVAVELESEFARLREHVAPSGQLGHQHVRFVADEAGVDVLVRIAMLQDRGHMLSALVRESSIADKRLLQR